MFGVKEIFVDDLRETFVRDFVFPMFRANALYEGQYLLGTSIARPLIAQRQIEIADETDQLLAIITAADVLMKDGQPRGFADDATQSSLSSSLISTGKKPAPE